MTDKKTPPGRAAVKIPVKSIYRDNRCGPAHAKGHTVRRPPVAAGRFFLHADLFYSSYVLSL